MGRKKKKRTIGDYLKANAGETPRINIARYTYDAWRLCFPDSKQEDYEQDQIPGNAMEYLCDVFGSCEEVFTENPDMDIHVILIDQDYFTWLGDQEDSPEARTAYTSHYPFTDEEMARKIKESGLGISEWAYSIPILGISKALSVPGTLPAGTVTALEQYFSGMITDKNPFSVYVSPYMMKSEDCCLSFPRILSMADAWFSDKSRVTFGDFSRITFPCENTLSMLQVPIVVRQELKDGKIKAGDLLAYMGKETEGKEGTYTLKPGWYLDLIDCVRHGDINDPDLADFTAPAALAESKAGKLLLHALGDVFLDQEMTEYSLQNTNVIRGEDIPSHCRALLTSLRKEARRAGIRLDMV